ncbi:MAG: adenosylcobinamide-GDP ribazoletransferase [Ignavibacteriaceae bacterium]
MKKQIKIFFTALMFFTRIPCPKWVDHSEEYLNKSSIYFPFIGWIVGGFSALILWLSSFIFPVSVAIIISMISSILVTGAFHEDGFADVCDGFGGGWTKEKILDIMKDSRIGAYGVIGLILILGIKFSLLYQIFQPGTWIIYIVIIAAHSLSRFAAASVIYTHNYVKENEDSKAKPLAKKMSGTELFIAGIFGLLPLFLFSDYIFLLIIIPVFLARFYLTFYFKKWIGGYTGDCLGAVQQVTEIVFYLSVNVVIWKYF